MEILDVQPSHVLTQEMETKEATQEMETKEAAQG